MSELPDKLSELIRVALTDLELCEKDPAYEINMPDWHRATTPNRICAVCLGGSVMAKSLGADPCADLMPGDFPIRTERKIRALNDFREGDIAVGLSCMHVDRPKEVLSFMPVHEYHLEPEAFKKDMRDLADLLEKHGL